MTRQQAYYPLFADLHGRRCLVVGGGVIAQRKVTTLLRYGARVTIVSPTATRRLLEYARSGKVRAIRRGFRPTDLRGAWLVCAATDDEQINQRVSRAANQRRIFVNVVDRQALCSFIAPAIARRGPLTVAVSTGGASPTVAKRLRDEVARTIGPDYLRLVKLLKSLRGVAKRRLPKYSDRQRYFQELTQGRVFRLLQSGNTGAARREALTRLRRQASRNGS